MRRFRSWLFTPRGALVYFAATYALVAAVYFWLSASAPAATFKCRGFSFIYTALECELPLPPATAGAKFCQVYTPVRWSSVDSRTTKEQVDILNRIWKRLCSKAAPK